MKLLHEELGRDKRVAPIPEDTSIIEFKDIAERTFLKSLDKSLEEEQMKLRILRFLADIENKAVEDRSNGMLLDEPCYKLHVLHEGEARPVSDVVMYKDRFSIDEPNPNIQIPYARFKLMKDSIVLTPVPRREKVHPPLGDRQVRERIVRP